MAEIAAVVNSSAQCNVTQLVHTEDHEIVPTRDWPTFLLPHFANIKKYHHFRFSSSTPRTVFVREHANTTEVPLPIL